MEGFGQGGAVGEWSFQTKAFLALTADTVAEDMDPTGTTWHERSRDGDSGRVATRTRGKSPFCRRCFRKSPPLSLLRKVPGSSGYDAWRQLRRVLGPCPGRMDQRRGTRLVRTPACNPLETCPCPRPHAQPAMARLSDKLESAPSALQTGMEPTPVFGEVRRDLQ